MIETKEKRQRRPVSRVPFPSGSAQGAGHFSRAPVARRLQRPNPRAQAGNPIALLFGLAPGGVCRADAVTRAAGELLPHRFTLTALADGGLLSVALIRGVSPPGRYPAPCPVEPGLSSRRVAATGDRPAFSGAGESIPRGAPFRAFDEDVAPDEHVAREARSGRRRRRWRRRSGCAARRADQRAWMASRASWSTRSFRGSPLWPRTLCQTTS